MGFPIGRDRYLYANDIIDEKPVCVRIDLQSDEVKAYSGAKYDLSPDDKYIISPNLLTMNIHQFGYAVPDRVHGAPSTFSKEDMPKEGLWRTNLDTNETELLVALPEFLAKVEGPAEAECQLPVSFQVQQAEYQDHAGVSRVDR